MQILVTGGAGYIGSHIVRRLLDGGVAPVVLDDLSEGHRAAVGSARLVEADFADERALDEVLGETRAEFIIHMAASCEVGRSMTDPAAYYRNNLSRSLVLLEAARRQEQDTAHLAAIVDQASSVSDTHAHIAEQVSAAVAEQVDAIAELATDAQGLAGMAGQLEDLAARFVTQRAQ